MEDPMADETKNKPTEPASRWTNFQPPALPEAAKLKRAVESARRLTPREVLQVSISAGIHNADGTLTQKYR
jgi:hypothetical protein